MLRSFLRQNQILLVVVGIIGVLSSCKIDFAEHQDSHLDVQLLGEEEVDVLNSARRNINNKKMYLSHIKGKLRADGKSCSYEIKNESRMDILVLESNCLRQDLEFRVEGRGQLIKFPINQQKRVLPVSQEDFENEACDFNKQIRFVYVPTDFEEHDWFLKLYLSPFGEIDEVVFGSLNITRNGDYDVEPYRFSGEKYTNHDSKFVYDRDMSEQQRFDQQEFFERMALAYEIAAENMSSRLNDFDDHAITVERDEIGCQPFYAEYAKSRDFNPFRIVNFMVEAGREDRVIRTSLIPVDTTLSFAFAPESSAAVMATLMEEDLLYRLGIGDHADALYRLNDVLQGKEVNLWGGRAFDDNYIRSFERRDFYSDRERRIKFSPKKNRFKRGKSFSFDRDKKRISRFGKNGRLSIIDDDRESRRIYGGRKNKKIRRLGWSKKQTQDYNNYKLFRKEASSGHQCTGSHCGTTYTAPSYQIEPWQQPSDEPSYQYRGEPVDLGFEYSCDKNRQSITDYVHCIRDAEKNYRQLRRQMNNN